MKKSRQHHLDMAEAILDDVAKRQTEGRKLLLSEGAGGIDVSPQVMLLNVGLQMGATAALAHATLAAAMTPEDEVR